MSKDQKEDTRGEEVYPQVVKTTAKAMHYPRGQDDDYAMILMHSKIPRGVEIPIAHIGGIHDFLEEYLKHRDTLSGKVLSAKSRVELTIAAEDSSATARHLLMSFDAVDGWRAEQAVDNIASIVNSDHEDSPESKLEKLGRWMNRDKKH